MEWFRTFVLGTRWRFAKTYVTSYPHEYTLEEWCEDEAFAKAIECIERSGVVEPFLGAQRKYLYVDDRFYWHMGDPTSPDPEEQPGLINRSWIDVARYRDEANKLGYEGDALEKMVVRWQQLLQRAKQPGR